MIVIFLSPILTPLTSMTVLSFLNSRLTSFQGARIGNTLSTPGKCGQRLILQNAIVADHADDGPLLSGRNVRLQIPARATGR